MQVLPSLFQSQNEKKTLYCDRVRTADGRTCKDIDPAEVSKRNAEYSERLNRLRQVRERWKNGELSDDEILMVVHELD